MTLSRLMPVIVLALVGAGCLNSTSLIRLKPDGSGTLEQTMLVNAAALEGMLGTMGGGQGKPSVDVLNETSFKQSAERMGMRPVSLTPVTEGSFRGARALYAFDDITAVRLDQDAPMPGRGPSRPAASPVTFGLQRNGATSVLTIEVDEGTTAEATGKAQEAPDVESIDPATMQMLRTMFDGFRIAIDLEVEGTIVETNADYVNGSRVTLVDLDLPAALKDESALKALQGKIQPGMTLSDLRPYLKDLPGVKVNHPKISIRFR